MLTVYRASAGSGKTHKLTGEYLKLLYSSQGAYHRILAVTFTNKATDEMKKRIIEELYNLSSGRSSDYLSMLMEEYSRNEDSIRNEAKKILISILHDYAAFNISTIDRFFQQTMRAFTREIGLQGGYGIEMDQELVLSEAIDNLLADLEKPENKDLLNWLIKFADDKIENGGEWNLRRDIMGLSREVFKEKYKAFSELVSKDIEDKHALENYKNELYKIIHSVENEIKALGEKGLVILDRYGLQTTDFKGSSNSPMKHFERYARGEMKPPTVTFLGLIDNVNACYTLKTSQPIISKIEDAFENGLNECIKGITVLFDDLTIYNTAKEIVRYYYTLGILNDISNQIAAYREDKNIMLIADTTELLNKVIDDSDAPFIYEKTGTHIDHYMIDEFQDTSGMQWNNFRPLIKESLGHAFANLIVGDVKQSIYRFRNSDWKLLDEQVQKDFMPEQVKEETLQMNWRSCRHIVEFNNAFFTTAPSLLQFIYNEILIESSLSATEQEEFMYRIMSAYNHSYQIVPPKFRKLDGHVKIDFLPTDEETDWKEESMNRLPILIEQLQDKGYGLKDIAILVRTNQEGALVADTLLSYKENQISDRYHYDIISDDALFIGSSSSVRTIITFLQYLKNTEDITNRQLALFAYATLTGQLEQININDDFPLEVKTTLQELARHSLYEIAEGLFRLFNNYFPENEQVFIQAFFDMIAEYAQKESADLSRFLKWWEDTGYRKTINTPDSQDAIRILTIHKSKGLGFKVVIIPLGDWEIDHKPMKQVILWCEPKVAPFNKLHLVPVRYSQKLSQTIFAKNYFEEKLHAFIDNLNTLYVAFTRAKEELIVFAPHPKKMDKETGKIEKISSISDLLWESLYINDNPLKENEPLIDLPSSFDWQNGSFELGSLWQPIPGKKEDKTTEEINVGRFSSISPDERLQLRLHGKGFFFDNAQRKYGALMHEILSSIRTSKDIPYTIEKYYLEGIINKEELKDITVRLETLLASPQVKEWFDGSITHVLNEVDILFGNSSKRPDRVMIKDTQVTVVDYKFGEQIDKRYQYQVRNYMKLIRQIGYNQVQGFIWYVGLDKIEEVMD